MNLTSASVSTTLAARAVPVSESLPVAGKRVTATATVGSVLAAASYPAADIAYALSVTATSAVDAATLDLSAGTCASSVGAPLIVGAGADFSGVALPVAATLYAIRFIAAAANTQAVLLDFTISDITQALDLPPGGAFLLSYATAGAVISATDEILATFAAEDDSLTLEVIAQTAG
jgi:hypothetical protein